MANSIFDFSRPRVRKSGRSLDKFALACELQKLEPSLQWDIIYDAFTYVELRDRLFRLLKI